MDYHPGPEYDYSDVVETLTSMFGNVICKDVIQTVVESCGGDLNFAADTIMNISTDIATGEAYNGIKEQEQSITKEPPNTPTCNSIVTENTESRDKLVRSDDVSLTNQPGTSFASVFKSTGAIPKKVQPKPYIPKAKESFWTEEFERIVAHHNGGLRTLVLMRGVPGSGKSYLAKKIVAETIGSSFVDYKTHICSTDDYFMENGVFIYVRQRLSDAHEWNHRRVRAALQQGLSPVIVDNTNIEIWEMEPYLREGVKNGYIIEVMEPNTPWAKKFNELVKRNEHDVPPQTIRRMLQNFRDGLTGDFLIKEYRLSYPSEMVPPVIRNVPTYYHPHAEPSVQNLNTTADNFALHYGIDNLQRTLEAKYTVDHNPSPNLHSEQTTVPENMVRLEQESGDYFMSDEYSEQEAKQKRLFERQNQMDEFEKVERDWDNGEAWDETRDTSRSSVKNTELETYVEPKPPRNYLNPEGSSPRDNLLVTAVQSCNDWRDIARYLPPWENDILSQQNKVNEVVVETKSSETAVEIGDSDLQHPSNIFKVITAIPRDINLFYNSPNKEKITDKLTLDKSTMTRSDGIMTETCTCKNKDTHFNAFRKSFKHLPKAELRDIFDNCKGDVNWAIEILLTGMDDNQLKTLNNDDAETSDDEEDTAEPCSCIPTCNVVPSAGDSAKVINNVEENILDVAQNFVFVPTKRIRPSKTAEAAEVKRQIEKNVVISDDHYSEHVLKIRKIRHGEHQPDNIVEKNENCLAHIPLDTQDIQHNTLKTESASYLSDDDESSCGSLEEVEKTVNVNIGSEFLLQLDNLFGRTGMTYPENVVPKINIPMSLLNEINAFWMESLMHQLDDHDKQTAKMILQDEEFARECANKEEELAQQGKEPEQLEFKDIMDMEFAQSMYHKQVESEKKNKEPIDLASKLTRDKLYNLFPEMSKEVLSEVLMAHDNNFTATVEVLLVSTGKGAIVQDKKALNKFIMQKQIARLREEKKTMSEIEWPLLPRGDKLAMVTVEEYRDQATVHLNARNVTHQKAQEYLRRGMTLAASYYNEVAHLHKQKYEQANSMAAAVLIQIHAENSQNKDTIDLHFFRVAEARETLDLFLDTHIQKLREPNSQGPRFHTLYFITGRGRHSVGGPKVKPAVKKRLKERRLIFSEKNPGLLTARVCAEDRLSSQIQVP